MAEDKPSTPDVDEKIQEETPCHSEAVCALLARTGYKLEIATSSRVYGGPPPDFTGDEPSESCQVFVGRLPVDMREDEIVPVFEKIGKIYSLRLIMERQPSTNSRGYAFLCFLTEEDAEKAIGEAGGHEIRPGVHMTVSKSEGNRRLYMGNIHKDKTEGELLAELQTLFSGVKGVVAQPDNTNTQLNRGYAFVDFVDHKTAMEVRRQCLTGRKILFGRPIKNVDWADIQTSSSEQEVKSLYIAPVADTVTEELLTEKFAEFGTVEKVQKIRNYAFVHMSTREEAVLAKEKVDRTLGGADINVSFANPRQGQRKRRMRGGAGRGAGGGGYHGDNAYPNFDYYGDPTYAGGEGYDYSYNEGYYGGGGGGYYDSRPARGGGSGVWMTKKRKSNNSEKREKWLDPNVADQIGGNAGGNFW